mmetsp:Transcript_62790/g.137518  ORF Transcript_62790/g.137518 Transcript_62790/m.137518 type:complete len:126 (-) Transcript_62790:90-467(-)
MFECAHCDKTFASEERGKLHLRFIHPDEKAEFKKKPTAQSPSTCCSCFPFLSSERTAVSKTGSDEHPSVFAREKTKVKVEYENSDAKGGNALVDAENCLCRKQPCECRPCMCGRSTVCVCEGMDF